MNFHKHTNEHGEVLILKRITKDRTSYGGFKWPTEIGATVRSEAWDPAPESGDGIHGWPWGFAIGAGCGYDLINDIWLILAAKPEDVVDLGGECKFREGVIRFEGSFLECIEKLSGGFAECVSSSGNDSQSSAVGSNSQSVAAGDGSQSAVAGFDSQSAAAGFDSQSAAAGSNSQSVAAGNYSKSTASGYNSKSTASGDYAHSAVAGCDSQSAAAGSYCQCEASGENTLAAIAGTGRVKCGPRGAICAAYYTEEDGWRFVCGKVGEDGIEADTWYEIQGGRFVKVGG